jgi:AcrR family transcriptional regulator
MTQTRRERLREETAAEIKQVARRQMAEEGAAALSLRAIAREMGLTAPALYRYYPNRDALVTALIVEAYINLGDAMEAAEAKAAATDYDGRWQRLAIAYRDWALAHREDYNLIYGTPIPGYDAPRDQTILPAGRILILIGQLLGDAWDAGRLQLASGYGRLSAELEQAADELRPYLPQANVPTAAIILTLVLLGQLHGLVWGELYEHFPPGLAESGELFQVEIGAISHRLGLG